MIINVLSIAVATLASFLLSSVWYVSLGGVLARLSTAYAENARMSPAKALLELLRVRHVGGWISRRSIPAAADRTC